MTRLLVIAFGPGYGLPDGPVQDVLATIRTERWSPHGCAIHFAAAPARWWESLAAAEAPIAESAPQAALLLALDPFAMETTAARGARNQADAEPDEAGRLWPGRSLSPGGPRWREATLPGEVLSAAIMAAGIASRTASDAGGYIANRCLYGLLARAGLPPLGCLRLPLPLETARRWGRPALARFNRTEAVLAVKAALTGAAAWARAQAGAREAATGAP